MENIDRMRKIYRIILLSSTVVVFIVILTLTLFTIKKVTAPYVSNTKELLQQSKNKYLKETVDNTILRINEKRESFIEFYKSYIEMVCTSLQDLQIDSKATLLSFLEDASASGILENIDVVLIEDHTKEIIPFENQQERLTQKELTEMERSAAVYRTQKIKGYEVVFCLSLAYLENDIKELTIKDLNRMQQEDDHYIWINEIIDYQGGENYAVCVVNPSEPHVIGQFLSTFSKDATGNTPYATELEEINKHGEAFYIFYTEVADKEEYSENLIYTKLYPRYNWMVSTKVNLDDFQDAMSEQTKESKQLVALFSGVVMLVVIFIFAVMYYAFSTLESKYYKRLKKDVKQKLEIDPMTGVYNRKTGDDYIEMLFHSFHKQCNPPILFIIDIDDFKQINDTYGHECGDCVIKGVANTIHQSVRNTDKLFRWGGEEFVLVCNHSNLLNGDDIAAKILNNVRKIKFNFGDDEVSVSVSIGVGTFDSHDSAYTQAISRADQKLYEAKRRGKDRYMSFLKE